jgi:hypothetical protein
MKTTIRLSFAMLVLAVSNLSAATLHVSLESTNPVSPYGTWETAATNIQHAVDASVSGDTVLVTNGVYAVGERDASVLDTNQQPPQLVSIGLSRVVVTNAIRLESVNGPLVTTIMGTRFANEFGVATNGIRCVFLGTNVVLSGFTLTNGVANYGGGLCCESASAVISNCTLTGNYASGAAWVFGGGAFGGTLYNCTLTGNSAVGFFSGGGEGGGACGCTLYNCTLTGNSAVGLYSSGGEGGGAYRCTLYNCTLTGNRAHWIIGWSQHQAGDGCGGGASWCTLYNCTLTGNSAIGDDFGGGEGGGAYGCTLYNCTLTDNSAYCDNIMYSGEGGGACWSTLYNCTLTGNSATWGGGAHGSTLNNCIVSLNSSDLSYGNIYEGVLNYCCTTPIPTDGVGNIDADPRFVNAAAGDFRLRPDSPCIDAGTNLVGLLTTDILGLPRLMDGNDDGIARVDMGAYEFNPYRFAPTLHLSASGFQFTVCGEPGWSVRIERSRDLVNWEYAGEVPIPACGQTLIDPAATSESRLFYRAIRVP